MTKFQKIISLKVHYCSYTIYFINVFVAKLGSTAGKFGEVGPGGGRKREKERERERERREREREKERERTKERKEREREKRERGLVI
jgi:hypothetical protein